MSLARTVLRTDPAAPAADPAAEVDAAAALPVPRAVAALAAERLRPDALATERHGVSAAAIAALRDAGALNHLASARRGGVAAGTAEDRLLHETIAGACLDTWLVWAQHAPVVRRLEAALDAGGAHPLVERVVTGRVLAGAALSDVRRYPERHIVATRVPGGWRLDGTVSWVSGWGLNGALLTAAVDDRAEQVLLLLVPLDGTLVGQPLDLGAVGGSRTVRLPLGGVVVDDSLVIERIPLGTWRREQRGGDLDAKAHVFGLAHRVLDELDHEPAGARLAEAWRPRVATLRARAYALADHAASREALGADGASLGAERHALRAEALEALNLLARGLVVARAGRGIDRRDTAQQHARNALFLLVQAQDAELRAAQLRALLPR